MPAGEPPIAPVQSVRSSGTPGSALYSRLSDEARVLGACLIFYFHMGLFTAYPLAVWGEYAVGFFIAQAGFAYAYFSLRRSRPPSFPSYLRARFLALWPAFALINLAIFLASSVIPSRLGRAFTPWELLLSLTGLSQYAGTRYMSVVMWFVPFIAQTYLLLGVLERLLKRLHPIGFLLGCLALSLALGAGVVKLFPEQALEICRNWSPLFRLHEVALGLVLARLALELPGRGRHWAALALYLGAVLALAFAGHAGNPDIQYLLGLPLYGLLATALIAGCAALAAPLLSSARSLNAVHWLGQASYPFFLLHGVMIRSIHGRFGNSLLPWILYFGACWFFSLLLVAALHAGRRFFQSRAA